MLKSYSFIGDTTYALLLYMLYGSDDMLKNTTYYIGKNLSSCELQHKIVMPELKSFSDSSRIKYRLNCIKYRHRLRKTIIYAQDHLYFSAPLIDNMKYTVLEDCPNFFTVLTSHVPKEPSFTPSLGAYWYNFKVGRIYNRYGGFNPWCTNRIITSDSDKTLFDKMQLNSEHVNLDNLWKLASDFKRKYILNAFALKNINQFTSKEVVLFSNG